MLDVLVLGSIRASTGEHDHPLGGAKQRALLARLVVARGRPVPPKQLIAELWDESPPRDAAHALQTRISRLRSAIPVEVELLEGGYRLNPAAFQTDAAQFESLYKHSGRLLAEADHALAAEHLHQALALWRGAAFEGIPEISTLQAESVRLGKLRAIALTDRIDLDLALGGYAAVVPELHALVQEQPFAERHWGQLIAALYCDGRPQEALEVFSHARATFTEHLGIEPSSELGQLHTAILREEEPRSVLRLPAPTSILSTVTPIASDGQPSTRALTSSDPDALAALLHHHRALLLTGPAGIGKTHLLRAIATRFEAQHCSAPLLTASPLVQTVPLGAFAGAGSSFPDNCATPAALIDYFSRRRSTTILLVDNIDQLDEASLFVVTQLIRNSRLQAILTSRTFDDAPDEIRSLYDSGEIAEISVESLSSMDADAFVTQMLGDSLTPSARRHIFDAARGNPLQLREVITASRDEDRLVRTEHGWELHGVPALTPRLTQMLGERISDLDQAALEAATQVSIAGEYPAIALEEDERRALARANVVEYSAPGWLRLAHPLDAEVLKNRCSQALWHELTEDVLRVLLSDVTADWPAARRRAHILALDLKQPIDIRATLSVAEYALAAFDERLALRAAQAVAEQTPGNVAAHRIAGLAASSLGMPDVAEEHFAEARDSATTPAQRTAVALAQARHLGMENHDAPSALAVIEEALNTVDDPDQLDHLRRDAMRWAVVAGHGAEAVHSPAEEATDAAAILGLITVAMSGVITGPLRDAEQTLVRLGKVPDQIIHMVPGGASLIKLTQIMALSNTGDVVAARRHLYQAITEAETHSPETLGMWEYALGFSELLSGDVERAYSVALSAAEHLQWRDVTGLLPAAKALVGATASATGRTAIASKEFEAISTTAESDPKVVMLRAWANAWREHTEAETGRATWILLDAARWLLSAQHTYFAGMLAHCAVRIGTDLNDAVKVLQEANHVAGGGLLDIFSRHGEATIAGDVTELDAIAHDAQELGMSTTAADTWFALSRTPQHEHDAALGAPHWHASAARLQTEAPAMALWSRLT